MRDLHRCRIGVHREADSAWAWPSRLGGAGRAARAGLRRLARPLETRQRMVSQTLAGGLSDLEALAALDAVAREAPADESVVLTETDAGQLLLHADDTVMTPLIRRDRTWEAAEARFLRSIVRRGAVVVDVGANVGYMTLLCARAAGPDGLVVAVEPEEENVGLLRANIWLNGFANVRVLPVAAWSQREFLPLRFNGQNRGDHQVGVHAEVDEGAPRLVPAVPLDHLLGELVVDVVKVDAQGSDHEAIAGLSETLARSPDAIVLAEFWLQGLEERGVVPVDLLRYYRNVGFSIALLREQGPPVSASDDEIIAACEAWPGRFVNLVLSQGTT